MPPRRGGPATDPIAAKAEQQDRPTLVTGCRNLLAGPHDTRAQRMGNRLAHPNRDTLLGKTCDLIFAFLMRHGSTDISELIEHFRRGTNAKRRTVQEALNHDPANRFIWLSDRRVAAPGPQSRHPPLAVVADEHWQRPTSVLRESELLWLTHYVQALNHFAPPLPARVAVTGARAEGFTQVNHRRGNRRQARPRTPPRRNRRRRVQLGALRSTGHHHPVARPVAPPAGGRSSGSPSQRPAGARHYAIDAALPAGIFYPLRQMHDEEQWHPVLAETLCANWIFSTSSAGQPRFRR